MAEHTQGAEFPNLGGGFIEPAFPVSTIDGFTQFGMTLRDYFAGQAVAGLCANPGGPYQANSMSGWAIVNCGVSDVAIEAYRVADAMLAERVKAYEQSSQQCGGSDV